MVLAVRRVCAIKIQRWFLHHEAFYRKIWTGITGFQALARGHLQRKQCEELREHQQSRQLSSWPKEAKKRPLDAFTAVIRIQSWARSSIVRKAYLHEHRLRASYSDVQWDKKKEGARNRILALVPAFHNDVNKEAHYNDSLDDPDEVKQTQSHRSQTLGESTPYKSCATSIDPSPMSMATAALTDLERTLEEARQARDLSSLSAPYVLDVPDYSYESGVLPEPTRLFDSESTCTDRSDFELLSSCGTSTSRPVGHSHDEDKGWTNPESLPNEWHQKHFDDFHPYSSMLSNEEKEVKSSRKSASDARRDVNADHGTSVRNNPETSLLVAAARNSELKRMIPFRGAADAASATREIGRPPSGNTSQLYEDPPLSMPMSFDNDDDGNPNSDNDAAMEEFF